MTMFFTFGSVIGSLPVFLGSVVSSFVTSLTGIDDVLGWEVMA